MTTQATTRLTKTTVRLNIATNPELGRLSLGKVELDWTRHALAQQNKKGVALLLSLTAPAGSVVELERQGKRTTKLVVRLHQDVNYDAVYVLVPRAPGLFLVVTCWLNSVSDNHSTLNKQRLGEVA